MKNKVRYVLVIMLLFVFVGSIYAASSEKEYTEEYKKYLELSDEEKKKVSVIPRKYVVTYSDYVQSKEKNTFSNESIVEGGVVPEKFFLGDVIDLHVDNQGRSGWCWAFGSLKCAETNYQLIQGKYYNLAEYHLAYKRTKELGGWQGYWINVDNSYDQGGSFYDFEKYVFNGYGPVIGENDENKNYIYDKEELNNKFDNANIPYRVYKTVNFPSITKYYNKER